MNAKVPDGWHNVTPRLVAEDPARLVEFLKRTFEASGEYDDDRPAQMRIGDSIIMVSGTDAREPRPAFLYVYVDDADAVYQRALECGAVSVEEPSDTPYGDRRAMVTDPWGNDWQIATYRST